jgi:hypothetical protein
MLNSSSGEEYDWAVLTKIMNDATFMELTQIGVPNNADIPRYKVEDLMLSLYEKRFHSSTECKMATNMFLQFCSDRTEIFVPSPNSNMDYRFYHRSFYEYFCAKHIEAQTTDVPSTYKALCKFDIDSEVIELLLSLYERRNPRYLRALVSYVFEDVEKSITDRISHDFSEMMEVLILIMQNVDETDFYERFVDLVLSISVSTTDLNILTEYRLIVNALKHNEQYFMKQFNLNRDEYLTRIRDVLADRIIQKKGKLLELMKKKNKNKSFTIDDICSNKGLECQWLLALLPDFDDILQSFFDVFADPKKVAMIRKGTRQGRSDLKSFADKVNALPYKERKRIYMASLLV